MPRFLDGPAGAYEFINSDEYKDASTVMCNITKHGFKAYIVGGCVRDVYLDKTPNDIDIATNALPEDIIKIFKKENWTVVPTGLKHGTVTVMFKDTPYEITTFRTESGYSDYRHPDKVDFVSTIEEDLGRRDFTINAIALQEIPNKFKVITIDPYNGVDDIYDEVIRAVGNPEKRFLEDPLRMLRAVRFKAKLNFSIEKKTAAAIKKMAPYLSKISKERIRDEFSKILIYNPKEVKTLIDYGLMDYIFPKYKVMQDTFQRCRYHMDTVMEHTLKVIDALPEIKADVINKIYYAFKPFDKIYLEAGLAALLHDMAKPETKKVGIAPDEDHFYSHPKESADQAREWLTEMRYPNDTIDDVCKIIYWHNLDFTEVKNPENQVVNRCKFSEETFLSYIILRLCDIKGQIDFNGIRFENTKTKLYGIFGSIKYRAEQGNPMSEDDLAVNGEDIMKILGIKPSKIVGEVKEKLYEHVFENPDHNKKEYLIGLTMDVYKELYNKEEKE